MNQVRAVAVRGRQVHAHGADPLQRACRFATTSRRGCSRSHPTSRCPPCSGRSEYPCSWQPVAAAHCRPSTRCPAARLVTPPRAAPAQSVRPGLRHRAQHRHRRVAQQPGAAVHHPGWQPRGRVSARHPTGTAASYRPLSPTCRTQIVRPVPGPAGETRHWLASIQCDCSLTRPALHSVQTPPGETHYFWVDTAVSAASHVLGR